MFHGGAQHTGASPAIGPATAAASWTFAPNDGYSGSDSAPVVGSDGTIYLARTKSFCPPPPQPGQPSCGSVVDAINPDGTLRWEWKDTAETIDRSTPAVAADGTVYVTSDGSPGDLIAIAPGGASTLWKLTGLNLVGSPTLSSDGTIYLQDGFSRMYAVRPTAGTVAWKFSGASGTFAVRGTPALSPDGTTVYFGGGGGGLYALNLAGQLQWQSAITGPNGGYIENAPTVGPDGTIYVAAGGSSGNTPSDIDAFTPAGALKWHVTASGTFETTPAVTAGGLIVAADDAGRILAVHAADGSPAWSFDAPGTYGTNGFVDSSPAVGADGTVYAQNGSIFAIKDGQIVWSAGGASEASPALDPSNGTLYVAGDGGLTAYPGPVKAATTDTLTYYSTSSSAQAPPVNTRNQVVLFITVTPNAGPTPPQGIVTFFDGATILGAATLHPYEATTAEAILFARLPAGIHSITAAYSGNTLYGPSRPPPLRISVGA